MTDHTKTDLNVYIIGVPASGKTTLVGALTDHLQNTQPNMLLKVISEVARELILSGEMTQQEIRKGGDGAIALQAGILQAQLERETEIAGAGQVVLSDRSGVDPIAFATKYCSMSHGQTLLESEPWAVLQQRMQRGIVILCEPIPEWFIEDGVRVVPASPIEYDELHQTFLDILKSQSIPFRLLNASTKSLQERVEFVVGCLQDQTV